MITSYNQTTQKKPMLTNAAMRQAASFHKSKVVRSLFNGSGKPNRPMSNLLDATPQHKLHKSDVHGLISLFRLSPKIWRDTQMWGAVAVEMLNPLFPFAKLDAAAKANRKLLGIVEKDVNENLHAPQFASVRLTSTGAEVSLPVVVFNDASIRHLAAASTLPETVTDFFASGGLITATETTMRSVDLKCEYLDKKLQLMFRALGCVLRIHSTGGVYRLFLDFDVTVAQVAYMCNTEFQNARAIDLYGLVRTWCMGRTSTSLSLPRSTRSLATIVSTLPSGGEPRTDADGVLIDYNATILYLPKEVNNVKRYDVSLNGSLLDANTGTVSQFDGASVKKMPVAQSVLLDWVNKKWSYTDGSGNLTVMDLSRTQPLSFTHIRALVFGLVSTDANTSFITKISAWSARVGGKPFDSFQAFTSNAVTLINLNPNYEGDTMAQLAMYHIAELAQMHKNPDVRWSSRLAEFEPYVNFCDNVSKVIADIKKDEDAYFMMTGNTVLGVSSTMAQAIVFDKWANKSDFVAEEDKKRRSKYLSAPIDAAYTLPALPYVSMEGKITPGMTKEQIDHAKSLARGLMPHQVNVSNQLRESPDYAILGVQAGGGKTMIVVTDILKEMQSGVKGPFLVLCPAHLVSQYVLEFTYTTNGRINVVAVTTYTIANTGYPALQKMIEGAPVNTVVVADYNLASGGTKAAKVGYGTSSVMVYQVVEFLRQFNFQYAACDESHKLKNQNSVRTRAIATLIADVPKKRLASGTFMDNSVSDIAGQFALLDPTVFGSVEKFNEKYSASGGTGRITKMRPGAELEIQLTLKSHSRYIQVKRKEWAAILPPRKEEMLFVDLTPNQRAMYEIIINGDEEKNEKGIVNSLKEEALKNDSLAKLLRLGKYANTSAEDAEADLGDLDEESNSDMLGGLDELLKPYLSRLEQFMVAPAADKLGSSLQGADRISPKVAELVKIFNRHVYEEEIPGKILVFTNQKASAEALYDGLPADVKKRTIMYTAGRKEECGSEFATDDNKVMMIGVSSSMDTGLNLQFCSRLVRAETVMSPGALEQGNARIGRPNLKDTEKRPATYYDWILVANSIDVTKVAYLMTKKVRIASVEEAGNPIFAEMEVPELFSLSLENITVNNTRESLAPYLGNDGMYRKFLEFEREDYQSFRDRNPQLLDANGKLKMAGLTRSTDLPGSTIMRRVPYVPGLNIYGEKELGLVRLDQYTKVEVVENGNEEEEDIEGDDEIDDINADDTGTGDPAKLSLNKQRRLEFLAKVRDIPVHTDRGEGFVTGVSLKSGRVSVVLDGGGRTRQSMLGIFVITKPTTSMGDVRGAIAKMAGDIPIDTPWEVKPDENVIVPSPTVLKKQKTTQHVDTSLAVELNLVVTNDMIGLEFSNLDDHQMVKTLKALKFTDSPQHYFAEFKTAAIMNNFFLTLLKKGYAIPKPQLMLLSSFYFNWRSRGAAKAASMFGMGTSTQQRNFYVLNHKPNPDKKLCTPYISCESSHVYLCLATSGNEGNKNVVRKMLVNGRKFSPALPTLQRFFNSPSEAAAFIRTLLAQDFVITNRSELHADFTRLRKEIPRATKKSMEQFYNEKEMK